MGGHRVGLSLAPNLHPAPHSSHTGCPFSPVSGRVQGRVLAKRQGTDSAHTLASQDVDFMLGSPWPAGLAETESLRVSVQRGGRNGH